MLTFLSKQDSMTETGKQNADSSIAKQVVVGLILGFILLQIWTGSGSAGFPGTNGLIAFRSDRDGNNEIYVMNADGTSQTRLTINPANDYGPMWSPDGKKIAFSSNRENPNFDVYVMNTDGSGLVRLTNNPAQDSNPSWSCEGTKIVFLTNRDGNNEGYVMDADGTGPANLSNHPADDNPTGWSPDCAKIAFNSNRDGNPEIYVMNAADGSGQTNLTNNPAHDTGAEWSPDSSKIAFYSFRDAGSTSEIYTMNADGSGVVRLTYNSDNDADPAWSPDGTKIAYANYSKVEIYVMNAADGSGQINLTNHPALDYDPDWQPLPIFVGIDIKPGSDPNCFNNDDKGVIPVAILGSATFNATEIDASSMELEGLTVKAVGKSNKLLSHVEDVNADGFLDLVIQIEDSDGVFSRGSGMATLTGNLLPEFGGTLIEGTDSVCIVP
jgi:Tol biopolymer transport system component